MVRQVSEEGAGTFATKFIQSSRASRSSRVFIVGGACSNTNALCMNGRALPSGVSHLEARAAELYHLSVCDPGIEQR